MERGRPTTVRYTGRDKPGNTLRLYVKHDGNWRIDKTKGKSLLVIEIMRNGVHLDYCPSAKEIIEIVSSYLRTEIENDQFEFSKPVMESHRPPEAQKKATEISEAIEAIFK